MARHEDLLRGTPYLIGDGQLSVERFSRVAERAERTRDRALAAREAIADQAKKVLPQFELAVRSDLVSESNRMEGITSSPRQIRDLAGTHRDLLEGDVGAFLDFVRDDPRLLESLGLYRAYSIADEWAANSVRPREFELRGLHSLVMPSLKTGGRYKSADNAIGGSSHVPTSPLDTPQAMGELAAWFSGGGSGDAVLDAAAVHAWVTHVHPFDDGNGRMARLLANLALIQAHYPPLLLRSGADRGQYLDALAASDDGDILPLYDLFVISLRRVVKTMEHPNYVQSKIRGDLLRTLEQRHAAWRGLARSFCACIQAESKELGWRLQEMGYPTAEHLAHLENCDPEGNCWFAKFSRRGKDRWLLWFGYRSRPMRDVLGEQRSWPSIFFSERTGNPAAVHPYEPRFHSDGRRPAEITLMPGNAKPAVVRWDYETREMQVDEAAALVARTIS